MEKKELKNKPLIEAIFELRWKLHNIAPGITTDPNYNLHKAKCILPIKAAHCLTNDPELLAAAVNAFISREAKSKCLETMKIIDSTDTVKVTVTMTKMLYALLMSQRFVPSKKFVENIP